MWDRDTSVLEAVGESKEEGRVRKGLRGYGRREGGDGDN